MHLLVPVLSLREDYRKTPRVATMGSYLENEDS